MQKIKKIMFIWQSTWPWDIRIDKEIQVLKEEGYSSVIVSRNIEGKKPYEILDDVEIYRIPFFSNLKLNNFLSTPFYLNPIWILTILKSIIKSKPDLIIVRDIPLALAAIFWAKLFKIKVIIDMAEPYPALIKVNDKFMRNPITKFLFKTLDWYKYIEKSATNHSDYIFVVVEEQIERLERECNVPKEKISIVSNTPFLRTLSKEKIEQNDDILKIVYTGNVDGTFRDIPTVIKALGLLKDYPVEFNIVGSGSYLEKLKSLAFDLEVKNVNFLGQMPFTDLLKYLNTQDIGIVPHDDCEYIKYTIPNKIFDYMAHSLPVIVPSVKPLEKLTNETNCGYVYKVCDCEDLAECIKSILSNRLELKQKGINGYTAVKTKYNWENDSNVMLSVIQNFLGSK